MESLTLRDDRALHNVHLRMHMDGRSRLELPSFQPVRQVSSNDYAGSEQRHRPRLAPIQPQDRRCDEKDSLALGKRHERQLNSASKQVQHAPRSPPHLPGEQLSNITLPPIRQIIPHHFSPPSTPDEAMHITQASETRNGFTGIHPQGCNKRMRLDAPGEPPNHRLVLNDHGKMASTPTENDFIDRGEQASARMPYRSRSSSEYSLASLQSGSLFSEASSAVNASSRPVIATQAEVGRNPAIGQIYPSRGPTMNLPPLSSLTQGYSLANAPDYDSEPYNRQPRSQQNLYGHQGGSCAPLSSAELERLDRQRDDRQWERRRSSIPYSPHDHTGPCHCNQVHGPELYRENTCYTWDIPSASDGQFHRKRRGNLPKDATTMFKKWYDEHRDSPYPSEEEKSRFCRETGLTLNQVGNWFINARRRQPNRGPRDGTGMTSKDDI